MFWPDSHIYLIPTAGWAEIRPLLPHEIADGPCNVLQNRPRLNFCLLLLKVHAGPREPAALHVVIQGRLRNRAALPDRHKLAQHGRVHRLFKELGVQPDSHVS